MRRRGPDKLEKHNDQPERGLLAPARGQRLGATPTPVGIPARAETLTATESTHATLTVGPSSNVNADSGS